MVNLKKILTSTALVSLIGIGSSFAVIKEFETPEKLKGVKVKVRVQGPQSAEDNTPPPTPVRTEKEKEPLETEPLETEQAKAAEFDMDLDAILNAALAEVDKEPPLPTLTELKENAPASTVIVPKEEETPKSQAQQHVPTDKEVRRELADNLVRGFQPLIDSFITPPQGPQIAPFTGFLGALFPDVPRKLARHERHVQEREANKKKYGMYETNRHIEKMISRGKLKRIT
ncbi:MAG: hypothetical protein BGO67_01525 [Alphaproteobacteria bacterium 41-28]|nr:MAG: hypothetical protein BGO67_01525 [Alphaproteobacteria bacterium 41-28]